MKLENRPTGRRFRSTIRYNLDRPRCTAKISALHSRTIDARRCVQVSVLFDICSIRCRACRNVYRFRYSGALLRVPSRDDCVQPQPARGDSGATSTRFTRLVFSRARTNKNQVHGTYLMCILPRRVYTCVTRVSLKRKSI